MQAALALFCASSVFAQMISFHISGGDLKPALDAFIRQSGLQLVYREEDVRGLSTSGVDGSLVPSQALTKLLAGTSLAVQRGPSNSYAITQIKSVPESEVTSERIEDSTDVRDAGTGGRVRVAQASQAVSTEATSVEGNEQVSQKEAVALQEVVVTAQKRTERLQDVPVPVSVLSGDTLAATDRLLLSDYARTVPGFTVEPLTFNSANLAIRGITTGGFSGQATVGLMLDGIPLSQGTQPPNLDPGDLARIEILRGPQGTLYGASSMGGVINYVTRDPDVTRYSGRFEAGMNFVYNGDKPGYDMRGAANIPLNDQLAIRISAYGLQDAGYIDNPVLNLHAVNEMENYGTQLLALWQPTDRFSLKLSALYNRLETFGSSEVNFPTAGYPQTASLSDLQQIYIPGIGQTTTTQVYSAIAKAKLGNVDLVSLTGLNVYFSRDAFDWGSSFGPVVQQQFGVSGAPFADSTRFTTFSQEVRLSSSIGQSFGWLLGGFYSHTYCNCRQALYGANPDTGQLVGTEWTLVYPSAFTEAAVFADLTYHFTERFDVQIGGRESHDTGALQDKGLTQGGPLVGPTPVVTPPLDVSSNAFTYLLTPRFKLSPDLMLYARFASGYRPGGGNPPQPGIPSEYGPDKTYNYELGTKGEFLDHRLTLDASVYYIDWKDIQLSAFGAHNLAFGTNGSRAKSEGVELSTMVKPATGLTLSGWVAYSDAALTENFPGCPLNCPVYGLAGNRLPFSSRFSGNLSIEQEFPLAGAAMGYVGTMANFVGDRLDIFTTTSATPRQNLPSYTELNLTGGIRADGWTFNLYANNITDKRGIISGGTGNVVPFAFNIIRPRTIGLAVAHTF